MYMQRKVSDTYHFVFFTKEYLIIKKKSVAHYPEVYGRITHYSYWT